MGYGPQAPLRADRGDPELGTTWEQFLLQIDNCLTVGVRDHVGVDVEGGRHRRMAVLLLHDLDRDAEVVKQ